MECEDCGCWPCGCNALDDLADFYEKAPFPLTPSPEQGVIEVEETDFSL